MCVWVWRGTRHRLTFNVVYFVVLTNITFLYNFYFGVVVTKRKHNMLLLMCRWMRRMEFSYRSTQHYLLVSFENVSLFHLTKLLKVITSAANRVH